MISSSNVWKLGTSVAAFLCLSAALAGAQTQQDSLYFYPNQLAEIHEAAEQFATAQQACESFGWAASIQTILRLQAVDLPQQGFVDKAFAGKNCVDSIRNYPELMKSATGDYSLDDGRKIRVQGQLTPPPINAEPLIASLKNGAPVILIWNNHPYLLYGVSYDLTVKHGNLSTFFVRELRMVDPLIAPGKEGRTKVFVQNKNDANQITALIQISVSKRMLGEVSKN